MTFFIAHRGNLYGPNQQTENRPETILSALSQGFHAEIDVWVIDDKLYLGHDEPTYETTLEFISQDRLWIHCKNKEALEFMGNTNLHYFWHQNDDYTITSKGVVWTLVGKPSIKNSICVMPELSNTVDMSMCMGICTDYPFKYQHSLKDVTTDTKMSLFRTNLDTTEYVVATYDMSCTETLKEAAWALAIGQSVGNPNVRNQWETDELFENHSCKILHTEEELESKQSGLVRIAFPAINTDWRGDGVSHLLVQLMGGQLDIDKITRCRLIDVQYPDCVRVHFKGPKYGMSGMRDFCGVHDRPLLGAIIKPKIGISPQVLLEMVKQLVEGGVNFIKEDEIMANPAFCSIEDRVPLVAEYLKDKNVVYAVCINGDAPYVLQRARRVHELGGNAIHINFWCGLGIYKSLRDLDLPLFIHFQKSGDKILTDKSHRFGIDWPVICDLAGMSGVDTIHAGMIGGYSSTEPDEMKRIIEATSRHDVVPALSCGMHPGLVEHIRGQVGNAFMANCGGCIHGHPGGTRSGALAMRQSIDRETDKPEYKSAIEKWGLTE